MMHLYPLVKCMWPCIMYTFFTREWVWTSPSILNLKLEKGVELNTTHWPTVFCSRPSRLSKAIWSVWVCCMSRLGIWLIRLGETNLPWRHVDASYCKLTKWLLYPHVSVAKLKKLRVFSTMMWYRAQGTFNSRTLWTVAIANPEPVGVEGWNSACERGPIVLSDSLPGVWLDYVTRTHGSS